MLIFIDSNILCSNYHMKGPSFEVAQRVGTIVLGQIVVDEVCNKFKENLVEQVTKVNNALRDLNKMLPDPPVGAVRGVTCCVRLQPAACMGGNATRDMVD